MPSTERLSRSDRGQLAQWHAPGQVWIVRGYRRPVSLPVRGYSAGALTACRASCEPRGEGSAIRSGGRTPDALPAPGGRRSPPALGDLRHLAPVGSRALRARSASSGRRTLPNMPAATAGTERKSARFEACAQCESSACCRAAVGKGALMQTLASLPFACAREVVFLIALEERGPLLEQPT